MSVRDALYTALAADATLGALLGDDDGIYHRQAPSEAAFPYVIFQKQAGSRTWSFAGEPLKPEVWLVKAVTRGESADAAEAIDDRVEELLNDAALTVADHAHLYLRRESDVDYGERDGAEQYQHVGATYRVVTQRT